MKLTFLSVFLNDYYLRCHAYLTLFQAHIDSLSSTQLAAKVPVRDPELSYSPFPAAQSVAAKYGNTASSINGSSIFLEEVHTLVHCIIIILDQLKEDSLALALDFPCKFQLRCSCSISVVTLPILIEIVNMVQVTPLDTLVNNICSLRKEFKDILWNVY